MPRVPTPEEWCRRVVRGCLLSYLEGSKDVNWLIGMIKSAGVTGDRLALVFDTYAHYGDANRYALARKMCEDQGLL